MYRISYFILLLSIFSCEENRKQVVPPPVKEDEFSIYEENLFTASEPLLQNLPYDRIRIVLHNPYGLPTYIYNISKFGELYVLESKEISQAESVTFTSKGSQMDYLFSPTWKQIIENLNKLNSSLNENSKVLYDGRTWIIESYIESEYSYIEIKNNEIPEHINPFFTSTIFKLPF